MSAGRIAAILALCATAAGCKQGLVVEVNGPLAAPVFTMSRASLLAPRRVCLTSLDVATTSAGGREEAVWGVKTDDLQCLAVTRITYGQPPAGFRTLTAAAPLRAGVSYRVYADGYAWSGARDFRFDGPDRPSRLDDD